MHNDTKYKTINRLNTDFRAEVVAAGLIESGQDADKVLIVREKGDKRHISKDIVKVKNEFSQEDLMEYLYIHTNRSSIYDGIPENIFHQPFSTAQKKSKEAVIEEMRRHRDEEFFARRYFRPFEMVADQLLIDAQLYERKFDKKNFHSNLRDTLYAYWTILKRLTLKQAVFFIKIIPLLPRIVTDFELTGKLIGVILDVSVKVESYKVSIVETSPSKAGKSNWQLGVNSVVGSTLQDGYEDLLITVGPACPKTVKSFSKGCNNQLILAKLLDMMLPANMQKTVKYKTRDELTKFRLSDGTHTAWLGINTRL
jgi:hypothetical protein